MMERVSGCINNPVNGDDSGLQSNTTIRILFSTMVGKAVLDPFVIKEHNARIANGSFLMCSCEQQNNSCGTHFKCIGYVNRRVSV